MPVVMNNPLEVEITIQGERELISEDIFKLAEALDAYEIEVGVKDQLVVDMAELDLDGMIRVSLIPKDMLSYQDIHRHIHILMDQALIRAGLESFQFKLKRVVFHPIAPGIPSRQANEIQELRTKVEKLWADKQGDEMKSYA
jgi:hypothetical protein